MIKYWETVDNRMRGLEKRGLITTPVPVPGADLPRDPAPESLPRRVTTLRTAAERVAPMEGPMESAIHSFIHSFCGGLGPRLGVGFIWSTTG